MYKISHNTYLWYLPEKLKFLKNQIQINGLYRYIIYFSRFIQTILRTLIHFEIYTYYMDVSEIKSLFTFHSNYKQRWKVPLYFFKSMSFIVVQLVASNVFHKPIKKSKLKHFYDISWSLNPSTWYFYVSRLFCSIIDYLSKVYKIYQ